MAMGSECVLDLYDENTLAAEAAEDEVHRIESRLSRHRDDSVLSRINQIAKDGGSIDVDEETAALIDYAFACHRKSDGLFDITTGILRRAWNFSCGSVPSSAEIDRCLSLVGLDKIVWERPRISFPLAGVELDFGGIGKEYAADRAAAVCAERGVSQGIVNLAGDIRIIGPKPDGSPWPIAIRNPRSPEQALSVIHLTEGGIATSGDYERFITMDGQRYGHILDPRTGWPARGLSGVSVVASTCLLAGSFSTIALLKGAAGERWLASFDLPSLWVDTDGNVGRSGWFKAF